MSITILAPYALSETTAAAIRLAELAIAKGYDVRLVATAKPEKGVHPIWDSRVFSGQTPGVPKHCRGSEIVIHFGGGRETLKQAKLTAEKAEHVLVPLWHHFDRSHAKLFKEYSAIVCPSQALYRSIDERVFQDRGSKHGLNHCRWDCGIPSIRRIEPAVPGRTRVLAWCDRFTIEHCVGPSLVPLFGTLLQSRDQLDITIAHTRSWAAEDYSALRNLAKEWDGRVRIKRTGDFLIQNRDFLSHDWTFLPAVSGDFGLTVARSLACGAPVVCHNIPPFNEQIFDHRNGVLMPCNMLEPTATAAAPIAVPAMGKMYESCFKAFDELTASTLRQQNWSLENHQKAFEAFWANLWAGLCP